MIPLPYCFEIWSSEWEPKNSKILMDCVGFWSNPTVSKTESRFHHWGLINGANHFAKWTTIIFHIFIKKLEEQKGTLPFFACQKTIFFLKLKTLVSIPQRAWPPALSSLSALWVFISLFRKLNIFFSN